MCKIIRDERGYYTLYWYGMFEGNYDTYLEAACAADKLMHGEEG